MGLWYDQCSLPRCRLLIYRKQRHCSEAFPVELSETKRGITENISDFTEPEVKGLRLCMYPVDLAFEVDLKEPSIN